MKVLLTGAFGNIGLMTLGALIDAGHSVRCFDLETAANTKSSKNIFKKLRSDPEGLSRIELVWGDICDCRLLDQIAQGVNAVIHLAAIIPPLSEEREDLSHKVNVVATGDLVQALKKHSPGARFIFASTVGVYGYQHPDSPPKKPGDPVCPVNAYGRQKVMCEELIRSSGLSWLIVRLGVCFDSKFALQANLATLRMQFAVRPEIRVEQIHPKDVALALSNAVTATDVDNKILLLGGGAQCRTTSGGMIQTIFDGIGIRLPDDIYGTGDFYTEWIDTSESEQLLKYQRHTLAETVEELSQKLKFISFLIRPVRPLVPLVLKRLLRQ